MAPDSAVLTIGRHSTLVEFTGIDVESPQCSSDHIHVNLNMDPDHLICSKKFLDNLWRQNSTLLLKGHEMAEEMPSEEELEKHMPNFSNPQNEDERVGWIKCYNWLKSKIVK